MKNKTNGVEALEALESMNRALILKCVPNVFTNKLYAIIKQALLQAVEDKKKVEELQAIGLKYLGCVSYDIDQSVYGLDTAKKLRELCTKELTSDE